MEPLTEAEAESAHIQHELIQFMHDSGQDAAAKLLTSAFDPTSETPYLDAFFKLVFGAMPDAALALLAHYPQVRSEEGPGWLPKAPISIVARHVIGLGRKATIKLLRTLVPKMRDVVAAFVRAHEAGDLPAVIRAFNWLVDTVTTISYSGQSYGFPTSTRKYWYLLLTALPLNVLHALPGGYTLQTIAQSTGAEAATQPATRRDPVRYLLDNRQDIRLDGPEFGDADDHTVLAVTIAFADTLPLLPQRIRVHHPSLLTALKRVIRDSTNREFCEAVMLALRYHNPAPLSAAQRLAQPFVDGIETVCRVWGSAGVLRFRSTIEHPVLGNLQVFHLLEAGLPLPVNPDLQSHVVMVARWQRRVALLQAAYSSQDVEVAPEEGPAAAARFRRRLAAPHADAVAAITSLLQRPVVSDDREGHEFRVTNELAGVVASFLGGRCRRRYH